MDESKRRIVILGKTAVGKSSLANTIFGEKLFKTNNTANSETSKCQAENKTVSGRSLTLIDSPGLFDTETSEEELKPEIIRCIIQCAPGPHAFLIVFKVENFTEHEEAVITKISHYFSGEIFKYATVLFTHGDQLAEGQTVEEYFQQNQLASDLLKKCGGRCHVIDNKYWRNNEQEEYRSNQFQVKELLKTIDEIIESNEGSCYTNERLQRVEEEIQQEEELIRQSSGTLTREEVREKAKEGQFNKLIDRVSSRFNIMSSEPRQIQYFANIAVKAAGVIGSAAVKAAAVAGGVIAAVVAAAGAVKGGVAGYHAAEGAVTAREAESKKGSQGSSSVCL